MNKKIKYDSAQHIGLGRVTATALAPDSSWMAVSVMRLDQDERIVDIELLPADEAVEE